MLVAVLAFGNTSIDRDSRYFHAFAMNVLKLLVAEIDDFKNEWNKFRAKMEVSLRV
jgi:hypothetical protein